MKLVLLLAALTTCALAQSDIVISQVYGGGGNTGAPLRNDYVELFNRGRATINVSGWSVQYASAAGTGDWQVAPITGTVEPGRYFLVQLAEGANTSLPALPRPDATGGLMLSGTNGKVALSRSTQPLSGARPADAVDLVGYGMANGFEGSAAGRALTNATALMRRGNGCTDTNDNAADFTVAEPNPRNSSDPRWFNVDCSAVQPGPMPMRISEVQGSGDTSPAVGVLVSVRGIVTGQRRDGFWMQSEPGEQDDDPSTSEGLFVYTAIAPPGSTGQIVRVTGTVAEFRPASDPASPTLTEIVEPQVEVLGGVARNLAATALENLRDLERFEGMLVSVPQLVAVSGTLGSLDERTGTSTSSGVFYAALPSLPRPFRTARDHTPESLRIDTRAQGGSALDVRSGSLVSNITGPLDFAFRTYTVAQDRSRVPSAEPPSAGTLPTRVAAADEFTIASVNLQRLFDTHDEPGSADVVPTQDAVDRKISKIARAIQGGLMSPDIIGVQEAENLNALSALARAAGDYEAHLLEGNDIGGIDVGLLVKRGRVQVIDAVQEGATIPFGSGRLWDRPPLVARIRVSGTPFTVIVVHMRSLIDAEDATVQAKRRAQAEGLSDLVATRSRAGEEVVVLGDFNTFPFDPLMSLIRSGGELTNLTDTLPPSDNYSYILDGVTQTLDHILLSPGARRRWVEAKFIRLNADQPEVLRGLATSDFRYSDHDAPWAALSLRPEALTLVPAAVTNAATFLSGPVAPLEMVTVFARGVTEQSRLLFDGQPATTVYAGPGQITAVVPEGMSGRASTSVQAETNAVRSAAVQVPVVTSAPGVFVISREGGRVQGAILNQDSTINGPGSAAGRGTVIQIFATGGYGPTGVTINGRSAEILYAGPAPGLVNGALQINARVPLETAAGDAELVLGIAGRPSPPVSVAVR